MSLSRNTSDWATLVALVLWMFSFGAVAAPPGPPPDDDLARALRAQELVASYGPRIERRAAVIRELLATLPPDRRATTAGALEPYFTPAAVAGFLYAHIEYDVLPEYRPALYEWLKRDGSVHLDRRINVALAGPPTAPSATPSAERRALLIRLSRAFHLPDRTGDTLSEFVAQASSALTHGPDPRRLLYRGEAGLDERVIVDRYLAGALESVSDDDLRAAIAFAETRAGYRYFGALTTVGFGFELTYMEEIKAILAHARPTGTAGAPSTGSRERAAKLLTEVRAAGAGMSSADAYERLSEALRYDPDNPAILAEAGLHATAGAWRGTSGLDIHGDYDPAGLKLAQDHLERALALDPGNGNAHVYLGYVEFVRNRNLDAGRHYELALQLHADSPWLPVNRADLAYARGDYAGAAGMYSAVVVDSRMPPPIAQAAFDHWRRAALARGLPAPTDPRPNHRNPATPALSAEEIKNAELEKAIVRNDLAQAKRLLQDHADPNALASRLPPPSTLLLLAYVLDRREIFVAMLERGGSLTQPQTGGLPIAQMCESSESERCTWLKEILARRPPAAK